ncbi:MAG: nucleotidyltransferase domain-containing protein [Nitrospirota bacterium]|jgi:predicted nucleotidyltransferase
MKKGITDIAERFGCILIYLFGSQAGKGKGFLEGEDAAPDPFSDLDVAVAFENPPTEAMKIYGEMYKEISMLFEPFNIDLVFMHEMSALFQYEIIKGIRIYEKDEHVADEFEEEVMKRAEDMLFKKKIFDSEVMEAIEDGYSEFEYSPNP